MPIPLPTDVGLPIWPPQLVAALRLVAAGVFFTLGVRELEGASKEQSQKDVEHG